MIIELTPQAFEILVIALVIAAISSVVTKVTIGKKNAEIMQKNKEIQAKLKAAMKAKDMDKVKQLQSEMLKVTMQSMQNSLKPMLITIIPFLLVFYWMMGAYGEYGSVYYELSVENSTPVYIDFYNGTIKPKENINFNLKVYPQGMKEGMKEVDTKVILKTSEGESTSAIVNTVFGAPPKVATGYGESGGKVDILPKYQSKSTFGEPVNYTLTLINKNSDAIANIFGIQLNWLLWYIVTVMMFSIILGKILKNY